MAGSSRWYFDKRSLADSPSKKCGIEAEEELSYRQQAANLIQEMGQRLKVTQLCINTAIVYMHRFYVFHSITRFRKTQIAACALFLAAKVEEQPRKLEYVVKTAQQCLNQQITDQKQKEKYYQEQANLLVKNENIMLQTLGFDIAIEHPHTFVVKCCQLVRASKDLAQTCYFMATNSLHLTTMCLQYKPTIVACVCIHLASKWSNWEIPKSSEGKDWFWYVDQGVSLDKIEEVTAEFLAILDKCPSRLKRKMNVAPGTSSEQSLSDRRERERREHEKREFDLRVEKDRMEREESERKEREKAERERLEKERIQREKLEQERLERVERERIDRERAEREKAERDRLDRLEWERIERERREEYERLEQERLHREREELEMREREKQEVERLERQRERAERERAERERIEQEQRRERERQERIDKQPPIKLKLKLGSNQKSEAPVPADAHPPLPQSAGLKIVIPKSKIANDQSNHSSSESRKRKGSYDSGSIGKKQNCT